MAPRQHSSSQGHAIADSRDSRNPQLSRIARRTRRFLSLLCHVRVPTQHGIFVVALLAGALLGALLAGRGRFEMSELVPVWLPAAVSSAAAVGGLIGAVVAGMTAWLVCRPRRAQLWTIDYPRQL